MKNYKFKKVFIKNRACYYIDDMIKLDDFDIDYILRNEITRKYFNL